jgi:NAD(P)-dependent dehydrogenase (short-subunit alcohol dehydrogenase family)
MINLFDLSGKVALITGGSRGLGREMALAFARNGADIIITSRKLASCEEVAEAVRGLGRRALAVSCHVGKWQEIDQLVSQAYDAFGRIDVLVNNAGMSPLAPSNADTSEELFDKVIDVNFKGPYRMCAAVGSRMAAREGGAIINVSSTASLRPMPNATPYAGAKAAVNAITIAFAHEYAPKVRVNAIVPGPFLTDVSRAWSEDSRRSAPTALGRPGRPEEIVTTALYLASSHSSFTTGALVRVDGGWP